MPASRSSATPRVPIPPQRTALQQRPSTDWISQPLQQGCYFAGAVAAMRSGAGLFAVWLMLDGREMSLLKDLRHRLVLRQLEKGGGGGGGGHHP